MVISSIFSHQGSIAAFQRFRASTGRRSPTYWKKVRYEAVHEITGWDDLRRRVAVPDRRLYWFFHPGLADNPLIFGEVALSNGIPGSIGAILSADRQQLDPNKARTAIFYSISNCQEGLRGISFGNFLHKARC